MVSRRQLADDEILSFAEACRRVPQPWAVEAWSPLTGAPWLVVALDDDAATAAECEALATGLRRLPSPSVALGAREHPAAAAFDVVVPDRDALPPIQEGIKRAPLAASALVQLLRGAAERDVEAGLLAESWVYSTLQAGPEFAAWLATRTPAEPLPEAEAPLRVEREGARQRLALDRPHRRTAYSAALRDALCEALELAACDDAITEIVLCGEGACFSAGGDLHEFGSLPDPATAHAVRTTRSAARWLAACAPRVRAELHGACIGAGIELPAFAGTVVARADAFFQLPELAMGLIPGAGGTVSLPPRIGRQRTAWMALTGARVDLATALDWGLVDGEQGS